MSEDEKTCRLDKTYSEHFATYRDLLAFRVSELHAAAEARSIAEERYFDGHGGTLP